MLLATPEDDPSLVKWPVPSVNERSAYKDIVEAVAVDVAGGGNISNEQVVCTSGDLEPLTRGQVFQIDVAESRLGAVNDIGGAALSAYDDIVQPIAMTSPARDTF